MITALWTNSIIVLHLVWEEPEVYTDKQKPGVKLSTHIFFMCFKLHGEANGYLILCNSAVNFSALFPILEELIAYFPFTAI
jgi:hypothetical protein